MIEQRCENCNYWRNPLRCDQVEEMTGDCISEEALEHISGHSLSPREKFGCPYWQEKELDLREQLAKYAHAAWCGWIKHMFRKGHFEPAQEQDRWLQLAYTAYCNLTEDEKKSDRTEADRILAIVKGTE